MRRFPWLVVLGLVLGIGLGLTYSWFLAPVEYINTAPGSLRADFKDRFRSLIAASYGATGNLDRARARLGLLADEDPIQALSAQAQRMLAVDESFGDVQEIAVLAADLQGAPVVAREFGTPTVTPTLGVGLEGSTPAGLTETVIPDQVIQPPATVQSPTPRPTRTATSAPGRPFELAAQDTLCEDGLQEGLLQVIVLDRRNREVPGAQIIVSWDGGEDHFYTGFKPELGDGYADFVMQPGIQYSVRTADGGNPVSDVMPPSCTTDGVSTTGQIRLTFQQQ